MNAVRPVPLTTERAVRFKAWLVSSAEAGNSRGEAQAFAIAVEIDKAEDVAALLCDTLSHANKAGIIVLHTDDAKRPEQRHRVSIWTVAKQTAPVRWERDSKGRQRAVYKFYPVLQTEFCVREGFEPVRPWRVEDGNAAGHDLTLVEG